MKIGFIGLGIMGKPMVRNLQKKGHTLLVYDVIKENIKSVIGDGISDGNSVNEITQNVDVIITMLPNGPHVKSVVMGENGILSSAKEGTIIIDMSSIAPNVSQEIAQACIKKGVNMIDAPVSGGEPKAIDGTLSIMVGGDINIFNQVKDILLCVGASAVYCGEIGAGNTTKLANQIVVAGNIAILAEAFTLAKKAGVDPNLVFDAIKQGLAGSTVMNAKAPMMLSDSFEPGFKIDLHIKDLNNALETGHSVGSSLPLTSTIMEMFQTVKADGFGSKDHSALAKYYEKISGEKIGG